MTKHELNDLLYKLLGSEDLVARWWHTPNRYWDGQTPYTVYTRDEKAVTDYVLFFSKS